jgi:hypothetical protein
VASHTHFLDQSRPEDSLPNRAAPLRLKDLKHVCRLYLTTHERQIALIQEARAARLREIGHSLAKSEGEDGANRQR